MIKTEIATLLADQNEKRPLVTHPDKREYRTPTRGKYAGMTVRATNNAQRCRDQDIRAALGERNTATLETMLLVCGPQALEYQVKAGNIKVGKNGRYSMTAQGKERIQHLA